MESFLLLRRTLSSGVFCSVGGVCVCVCDTGWGKRVLSQLPLLWVRTPCACSLAGHHPCQGHSKSLLKLLRVLRFSLASSFSR